MKKRLLLFASLALLFCTCTPKTDTLVGTWTVDKVNVQFDEQRNTPELVKQVGEMEKQNIITIGRDSTLTFKGLEETLNGRLSLKGDGTLLFDGAVFGIWKNGEIVTKTDSPLGEVVVTYKKE